MKHLCISRFPQTRDLYERGFSKDFKILPFHNNETSKKMFETFQKKKILGAPQKLSLYLSLIHSPSNLERERKRERAVTSEHWISREREKVGLA